MEEDKIIELQDVNTAKMGLLTICVLKWLSLDKAEKSWKQLQNKMLNSRHMCVWGDEGQRGSINYQS